MQVHVSRSSCAANIPHLFTKSVVAIHNERAADDFVRCLHSYLADVLLKPKSSNGIKTPGKLQRSIIRSRSPVRRLIIRLQNLKPFATPAFSSPAFSAPP